MNKKYFLLIGIGLLLILGLGFLIYNQKNQEEIFLISDIKQKFLDTFSQLTIQPISKEYLGTYKVLMKTGNESLYDVSFSKDSKTNITTICLEANFEEKQVITYLDIEQKEIDKNYTYSVPTELLFYKTKSLIKQIDLSRELEKSPANLQPSFEEGDKYKFCYQANPEKDFYLKFGDNSVIVIQENVASTDAILVNVTAETNFTHLTIDNTTTPYDSLVLYLPFDGDKTNTKLTTHYDFTKENNDGTGAGDAVVNSTNCIYDDCLQLDGDGDYVDVPHDSSLNITGNLTISMWVNPSEVPGAVRTIIGKGDAQSLQTYQIRHFDDDVVFSNRVSGSEVTSVAVNILIVAGWTHILAVRWVNSSTVNQTLYIDGIIRDSDEAVGQVYSDTNNLFIGKQSFNLNFNGTIDEVMIFNTTLTEAQIIEIYNNQSARFVKEGLQQLNNQSYLNISSGNDKVNVSATFENFFQSNLSLSVGYYDGDWSYTAKQNLTSEVNSTFTISDTSTNLTLNFTFIPGNSTANPFYTPILKGDIILDVYSSEVEGDTTDPDIVLNAPINNYNSSSISLTFNCTGGDNINLTNVTLYGNWTGGWHLNETNSSGVNDTDYIFTKSIADGDALYVWNCQACDNSSNCVFATNRTFRIDTIFPEINITFPINNTNSSNNQLSVNYTYSDLHLGSCWYSNDSYSTNTSLACGTNISEITWVDGKHNVTIWINDSANNVNSSRISFNIDTVFPEINLTYPQNTTYSTTTFSLNYTYTETNPHNCWYYNGTANSSTAICGTNWTGLTASEGSNTWRVYINDSAGNENQSSVTFEVDTTAPTFDNLANQSIYDNESLSYDIDATDTGVGVSKFAINWTATFSINEDTGVVTNTSALDTIRIYYINVSVNDTLGNLASGVFWVNVSNSTAPDTTAPTFDNLINHTHTANTSFSYDLDATDAGGVDTFTLNNTDYFNISSTGLIINVTNLSRIEIHYLNVTVNDTSGNMASGEFWINITEVSAVEVKKIQIWRNRLSGINVSWVDVGGNWFMKGGLNVTENSTFQKDVIIEGTLYGGSPVKIAGINITNNLFSLIENKNSSLRFTLKNLNSGTNASTVISAINDMDNSMSIGIGSSNFMVGSTNYPNTTVLLSRSKGKTIFANLYNQMFLWLYNPSDDNDPNNLVELMRLDEKGLNVSGNITSENLFISQYIFAHNNATMVLDSANVWANLSFDQEIAEIKKGISHTFDDSTNHTFTINEDGIYDIDYNFDVIDTSASSTDIDVAGRVVYSNGTEISGSVFEVDIVKKNIENEISHSLLARFLEGDVIVFQFVASDVDVEISTHGTFGVHPESVTIRIEKVANL